MPNKLAFNIKEPFWVITFSFPLIQYSFASSYHYTLYYVFRAAFTYEAFQNALALIPHPFTSSNLDSLYDFVRRTFSFTHQVHKNTFPH
jgi:hypothetical protein